MDDQDFVKIIVVGDSGTGKTSLIQQYCTNKFSNNTATTIGTDFHTKIINHSKYTLKLQIWDIAGQERYNAITKLFIKNAKACIILTDVNNEQSLKNSIQWKEVVSQNINGDQEIPIFLAQNKIDILSELKEKQEFQEEDTFLKFGEDNYFTQAIRISVKNNINIDKLFQDLISYVVKKRSSQGPLNDANNFSLISDFSASNEKSSKKNKIKSKKSKKQSSDCC